MLTVELVPKTSWYANVRKEVTKKQWNIIKKQTAEDANHICQECGSSGLKQGRKHAVECHEIWQYDDKTLKQTLVGFIALCPRCHNVKHFGKARMLDLEQQTLQHFCKVNKMTAPFANAYINEAFRKWFERSQFKWEVDMSYLKVYNYE